MSGWKLYFVFLLLFFPGIFVFSQSNSVSFRNITINDGLSQNSVVSIAEDTSGFMWFATQDGLNRFDGTNFISFPRSFDDVTTPLNSQLGKIFSRGYRLWLITRGGKLEVLDICTQQISSIIKTHGTGIKIPALSDLYVGKEGEIWLGSRDEGVIILNPDLSLKNRLRAGKDSNSLSSDSVQGITALKNGNIWIMTSNGADVVGGAKFGRFLEGINTSCLTETHNGNIWLGSFGKGVFLKKNGSDDFVPFTGWKDQVLPGNLVVESLLADKLGRIWVGTYGSGLYLLDPREKSVEHFMPQRRDPNSLGFQDVLSLHQDRNNGIWIGTDGGGVSFYNRYINNFNLFTGYNVPENISIEQIRAITTDRSGNLWLGTSGNGLTCYNSDNNSFQTIHLEPYKPGISNYDRVVSVFGDQDGFLWIGTHGNGLLIMGPQMGKFRKWMYTEANAREDQIPDNTIWCFLKKDDRSVFAGTRNEGLLLLDREKGMVGSYRSGLSGGRNVRALERINDSVIALGYEKKGIEFLNTNSGKFSPIVNKIISEKLENETGIKSLMYRNGYLWIGTAGKGLIVYHLASGSTQTFGIEQGLPNNMIYSVLPAGKDEVWLSSNKGLCRIAYTTHGNKIVVEQINPYTSADGLQSNEFNTGAYHRSADGTLYFGGIRGVNFFDPHEFDFEEDPVPVVLTQARIGNKILENDTLITYKDRLDLKYEQRSLSFDYTALDFVSPEKMNYSYFLEGYDEDWIEAGDRQYVAYTNLPAGDYSFKVRVSNKIRKKTPVTSLGISIARPFWLSWWFILALNAAILLIIYIFYRYRIDQLLKIQRVKDNISADLHDDLGSRLTSIHFLSAISKRKISRDNEAKAYLEGIDREVQASSEALDEIVWNIRINDESLEDIVAKMRRYAGEIMESNNIEYEVKTTEEFSGKKMSMQKRRELFLVFKEIINNIRKHSEATKVMVRIGTDRGMFYLRVKDNGKGFDPEMETHRNGIRNMRYRVEKWKGLFSIVSQPGKGVKVELWIPFEKISFLDSLFRRYKK